MQVFKNRAEAEAAGFMNFGRAPDQSLLFMHGKTAERVTVRTDLEAQLAEALERMVADFGDVESEDTDGAEVVARARAALAAFRGDN